MKTYTKGQTVIWNVNDFDGNFTQRAVITEIGDDYAIATTNDGTTLYIDNDTDYMFTISEDREISAREYVGMTDAERADYCRNKWVYELAQRIIDVDYYGAMDADETPETIAGEIMRDPLEIISGLLDIIEDYQEV